MNIIVVFPKLEDAKNIRNALVKNGFLVPAICTTGAQVLQRADELGSGIVVSGYSFSDMIYSELQADLPQEFEMLLVASQRRLEECRGANLMCVSIPIKLHDLINTLNMMQEARARRDRRSASKPRPRSERDTIIIRQAKELLMARNNMTESEAHRYIQKCSMDNGTNMVETAKMVLSLMA